MRRAYFTLWAQGWAFLALALFSLFVAFRLGPRGRPFEVVYLVSEWLFVFFLIAGLRVRAGAAAPRWSRAAAVPLAGAIGLATFLSGWHANFSLHFIPQAGLMALAFAAALWCVVLLRRREGATPGRRIVTVALAVVARTDALTEALNRHAFAARPSWRAVES